MAQSVAQTGTFPPQMSGSVFSTTQVFPLIPLTLVAWKHTQIETLAEERKQTGKQQHVMEEVRLFLLGANFGYVFDAGLMGSLINLPVINYYEPATFSIAGQHPLLRAARLHA